MASLHHSLNNKEINLTALDLAKLKIWLTQFQAVREPEDSYKQCPPPKKQKYTDRVHMMKDSCEAGPTLLLWHQRLHPWEGRCQSHNLTAKPLPKSTNTTFFPNTNTFLSSLSAVRFASVSTNHTCQSFGGREEKNGIMSNTRIGVLCGTLKSWCLDDRFLLVFV